MVTESAATHYGRAWAPEVRQILAPYDWHYAAAVGATALGAWVFVVVALALGPEGADTMVHDLAVVVFNGGETYYYTGLLSNLGVLVWAAGAGLLALAARVSMPARRRLALVHAVGALLTAFLATDDLVLLHDGFFPAYVGLPEEAVLAAEAVALGAWVLLSLRVLQADPALPALVLALALLGTSVLLDVTHLGGHAMEEGAKLGGIVAWSLWAWGSARWAVARSVQSSARE